VKVWKSHSRITLRKRPAAFTLIEMLVSVTVLALIMVLMVTMIDQVSNVWTSSTSRTAQFKEARRALDIISNRLSQATLGTYWDYDDPNNPTKYIRQSNLRFLSGPRLLDGVTGLDPQAHSIFFQAPLGRVNDQDFAGLPDLLNTVGYYVSYGSDEDIIPDFADETSRFRLYEMIEPSEELSIYNYTSGFNDPNDPESGPKNETYTDTDWFVGADSTSGLRNEQNSHLLADNIIALVFVPRVSTVREGSTSTISDRNKSVLAINGSFHYDSSAISGQSPFTIANPPEGDRQFINQHQLPPIVDVYMFAVDEKSMRNLEARDPGAIDQLRSLLASLFKRPADLESDLQALEDRLNSNRINYRKFQTSVPILGAKWGA